ncbi:hypothetical protein BC938DRAFT_479494, partial [Jimgerdemannia flammicorona]
PTKRHFIHPTVLSNPSRNASTPRRLSRPRTTIGDLALHAGHGPLPSFMVKKDDGMCGLHERWKCCHRAMSILSSRLPRACARRGGLLQHRLLLTCSDSPVKDLDVQGVGDDLVILP